MKKEKTGRGEAQNHSRLNLPKEKDICGQVSALEFSVPREMALILQAEEKLKSLLPCDGQKGSLW